MPATSLDLLLLLIDEGFDHRAWHGPNLRGSVRGVSPAVAAWRPDNSRHSIAEQVVHAAYWKYAVRRRLLGEKRGSFPLQGSNWFARPDTLTATEWRADIALLDETHRALRAAIAGLEPGQLARKAAGRKFSNVRLITGIAAHDVYHAGQIQLLKRLSRAAGNK